MPISGPGLRGSHRRKPKSRTNTAIARSIVGHDAFGELGEEGPKLGDHGVTFDRDAGYFAELADDHEQRDAGHVADEHWVR